MKEIAPPLGKNWETRKDGRQFSPACERNSNVILEILQKNLRKKGSLLEIASGTGQHAIYFSPHFPDLKWQPTDLSDDKILSIRAWAKTKNIPTLLNPIKLDAMSKKWPFEPQKFSNILCINMIHIAPFDSAIGLFEKGWSYLKKGGCLCLYGPFKRNGAHTSPSNEGFNKRLMAQNGTWGGSGFRE